MSDLQDQADDLLRLALIAQIASKAEEEEKKNKENRKRMKNPTSPHLGLNHITKSYRKFTNGKHQIGTQSNLYYPLPCT